MTRKLKDMTQDPVEFLRMVVALGEERSVQKAAKRLNIDEKTLWKFFKRFELDMETPFFQQAFFNNFLTGPGERLYEQAKKVLVDLTRVEKLVMELSPEPAGTISIVTMPFVGTEWMLERLASCLEKYPRLRLKLTIKTPPIRPGEGDIVISMPTLAARGMYFGREILSATYGLYASSSYLSKFGVPETLKD